MRVENRLINGYLRVSKISRKFCISIIYDIAVIYLWNLLFFKKGVYFLTVSIAFSGYKQNLNRAQ